MDRLARALMLQSKIDAVTLAAKIVMDDNDDLSIANQQQVTGYVNILTNRRDNLITTIKNTVAGW